MQLGCKGSELRARLRINAVGIQIQGATIEDLKDEEGNAKDPKSMISTTISVMPGGPRSNNEQRGGGISQQKEKEKDSKDTLISN